MITSTLLDQINTHSKPLEKAEDLDVLISRIGDAHFVLLGEASHGTQEYYEWRSKITKRLIQEKDFSFIAVEGDWPDCYEVNQFIKGHQHSSLSARDILNVFQRWPSWMWANEEMVDLVGWLFKHNKKMPKDKKVGFYGLDVYSLWESMYTLMAYLRKHDPEALQEVRKVHACFEPYGEDAQEYARATATRFASASCEEKVAQLLTHMRTKSQGYEKNREKYFNAEQNALVIKNAEHYYRTMAREDRESWNIRDAHMVETLERLMRFHGKDAKVIVWEHNTHIGDARATDMYEQGTFNVGQLIRENHRKNDVVLIGFGSHRGEVIAGDFWGAPFEKMPVPPARKNSWEDMLHFASPKNKLLIFDKESSLAEDWFQKIGHRAIGVVYHPEHEYGNYVPTILPLRYDAFCYIDRTHALNPISLPLIHEEVPETFPTGL